MFRHLTAALVFAALSSASAQTPQLPPLPRPVPISPQLQSYTYTATTGARVRRSGAVTAAGITWACGSMRCTVSGQWLQPGITACAALAREVGRIIAYGRPGAMLGTTQLAQCNAPPSPSPPPPPPPPATPAAPSTPDSTPAPSRDPGIEIHASELSVVGAPIIAPGSIVTSELSVIGGAVSAVDATPPLVITTSELSVMGR